MLSGKPWEKKRRSRAELIKKEESTWQRFKCKSAWIQFEDVKEQHWNLIKNPTNQTHLRKIIWEHIIRNHIYWWLVLYPLYPEHQKMNECNRSFFSFTTCDIVSCTLKFSDVKHHPVDGIMPRQGSDCKSSEWTAPWPCLVQKLSKAYHISHCSQLII